MMCVSLIRGSYNTVCWQVFVAAAVKGKSIVYRNRCGAGAFQKHMRHLGVIDEREASFARRRDRPWVSVCGSPELKHRFNTVVLRSPAMPNSSGGDAFIVPRRVGLIVSRKRWMGRLAPCFLDWAMPRGSRVCLVRFCRLPLHWLSESVHCCFGYTRRKLCFNRLVGFPQDVVLYWCSLVGVIMRAFGGRRDGVARLSGVFGGGGNRSFCGLSMHPEAGQIMDREWHTPAPYCILW